MQRAGAVGLGSSNDFHKPFRPEATFGRIPVRMDAAAGRPCDVIAVAYAANGDRPALRYGLVNATCQEEPSLLERLLEEVRGFHASTQQCAAARAGGSVIGAVLAALGASVVAVLILRAMAEWRVTRPDQPPTEA